MRTANAVISCAAYVAQMFWPTHLAAFYPYPRHGVDAIVLLAASALLAVISAAAYRWRRQVPWFGVGWLWYLVMLAPVLGLIQAGEVSRADRYTYLPQIGLYLIVAWAAGIWCAGHQKRRVLACALAVIAIVAASLVAFRQTGFWKDSETLWNRALACTSSNDTAHYNLGTARLQEGRLDEAIAHYQKTLEANPAYADAHMNLGRALLQKGMTEEAIAHYRKAIDIKPRFAEAHYNLAVVLTQKHQVDDAIAHYQQALEINPAYFDAHNNLGSVLLQSGRVGDAIAQYEIALRIDPRSARAHNNLAAALVQKGHIAAAISHYQKVLEIDPGHAKAHNSLAWLLATSSDATIRQGVRAVALAEKANQLTGETNPLFLRTLAAAYAESDRFEDAVQTAQHALDFATAQGNDTLTSALREDLELFKARKPVR
jgi:tetratricopeptide (TPR) repeat protein